ncbi:MAG: MATE family efflux transporter [Candidatus Omnitrophota bacterium]
MLRNLAQNKNIKHLIVSSWSISWPMTLIMFFMFLIGLADVYVAGLFGKEVQAAYGFASQLYFVFGIIGFALTTGAVSVVSRLHTSHHQESLHTAVDSSLISSTLSGIALSLLALIFSSGLVRAFDVPAALKGPALSLMRFYSLGLVFSYILVNTNGILRACGMIKKSLWTMVIVCLLNIWLNFTLSFGTTLRFQGIVVATIISTGIGCILNLVFLKRIMLHRLKFSLPVTKKIVSIGWPAGMLQILWQLAALALFLIISALPVNNVETLAAFTNGLRIEAAIFLPAFAFNMAAAVVVGNLLGKKNKEDAFWAGIVTALLGLTLVTIMTVAVMFNARNIAGLLSNNELVINECVRYIYIALLFEPVMAWSVILAGGLNGAGDTKSVMVIVALCVWLVRVPLSYILALHFGIGPAAVWWAMNISISFQAIFITGRYFSRKWLIHAHVEIPV